MRVYCISGYDPKDGHFRSCYIEANNKTEARKWAKQMGYKYYPETKVEFVCNGGYEELDKLDRKSD